MKICPNSELGNSKDQIIGFYKEGLLHFLERPVDSIEAKISQTKDYRSINSCETKSCHNWNGKKCNVPDKILSRIKESFLQISEKCSIRKDCRWFHQEGIEICKKCPAINFQNENITSNFTL